MKTFLKNITPFIFVLNFSCSATSTNIHQTPSKNSEQKENVHKIDISQEIKNCIFLEKQLLPQEIKTTFSKKISRILINFGIPVVSGLLISTTVYSLSLKHQKYLSDKLTLASFLLSAISLYFLIKYATKTKMPTDFDRLLDFVKEWPQNKILTPEKFYEKFESLFFLYKKNQLTSLSQVEAEKIVRRIIMDLIDYKISLQFKEFDL